MGKVLSMSLDILGVTLLENLLAYKGKLRGG